jgi:hypothetical protein
LTPVVPDTTFHQRAPVLLGTNRLQHCYSTCIQRFGPSCTSWPVTSGWKNAYECFTLVKDMAQQRVFNTKPQGIPDHHNVIVAGVLPHPVSLITNGSDVNLPAGLVMSSSVVDLQPGQSTQKVCVHLYNISAKDVTIPSNACSVIHNQLPRFRLCTQ